MEDVIVWLIWGALIIGGAVSSASKKKKEAARKAAQHGPNPQGQRQGMGLPKSLSEILEELEQQQYPAETAEPAAVDYFEEEMATLAEQESAAARLEAMTYTPMVPGSVEQSQRRIGEAPIMAPLEEPESEDILGEFDLKRAVIESEILRPKFEQY